MRGEATVRSGSRSGQSLVRSTVSLFSGCGGFDTGFLSQDFRVLEAHDIDPVAISTYNRNHASVGRISDLRPADIDLPKCDIIIAGPPCQGFSTIGSLRPDDERNSLLIAACEMIRRRRPKLVLIENVMGLLINRNRSILEAALSILSEAGYFVDVVSVKGEQLGLAQRRRRVIIIGRLGKAPFSVSLPISPQTTVREALKTAGKASSDSSQLLPLKSKARLIAEKIKPGQKLCNVRESAAAVHTWDIPEVFGVTSMAERELLVSMLRLRRTERERTFGDADPVSLKRIIGSIGPNANKLIQELVVKGYVKRVGQRFDLAHTFNGTYRRLAWNNISPTVDTHFGSARLFLHPEEHRGLSISEAAALQGFCSDFKWPESKATAYRLIGNAVPPPISRAVAKVARALLS